jgi:putative oxidoreductase
MEILMTDKLMQTDRDWVGTVLRWTLAIVIFPHGAQKVLGWFGGYGFTGTLGFFTESLGVPALVAVLVFAAEFLGPIALAAGFFSRVAAAGIGAVMLGAIVLVHGSNGFFMNWTGSQAGQGFEYHLLVIGLAVAILLKGSGRFSIDARLAGQTQAA